MGKRLGDERARWSEERVRFLVKSYVGRMKEGKGVYGLKKSQWRGILQAFNEKFQVF